MKGLLIISLVLGLTIIALGLYTAPKLRDYEYMLKRQEEQSKINLRHQGGTSVYFPPNWDKEKDGKFFNYMIHSWDGGKNWYATEYDDEWGIKILGDAKVLYPDLLEYINGMKQLTDYVEKNGSIDGTDSAGIKALENAGFTVVTK